jgi:colanic acid/amylovoran biosynthesis protein
MLAVKYLNYYIMAWLLLLLARPHNKILHRQAEKLKNKYLTVKPNLPKQTRLSYPLLPQPEASGQIHEQYANIVIVNQHGANRGDEAALKGMLYGLKKLIPEASFTVLTMTPAGDFRHIKEAVFIDSISLLKQRNVRLVYFTLAALLHRFGIKRISKYFTKKPFFMQTLKNAALVISAPGGPYIGDMYQMWEVSCAFQIYIPILLGKPVMIYGPSQGPFDNEKRNKWRKWLLSRVKVISTREEFSKIHLENLGIDTSAIHVTADSCLQQPVDKSLSDQIIKEEKIQTNKTLIGVVPLCSIPFLHEVQSYDVQELASKTMTLLAEAFDANFIMLPQTYGSYPDLPSMKDIACATGFSKRIHILGEEYDSDQQQSLIGRCDLFVSFRYHPFIFAARQAVPSVCIAYEHKAFGFAKAIGLEEYCLDLFNTTPEEIVHKTQQAWNRKEEFKQRVRMRIASLEELSLKNSRLAAGLLQQTMQKRAPRIKH